MVDPDHITGNTVFYEVMYFNKASLPVQTRMNLIPKNPVLGLELSKKGNHN